MPGGAIARLSRVTRIAALFLGGTISMAGRPDPSAGRAETRFGAADLLAAVPQLAALGVQVRAEDVRRLPSAALGFADVLEVVARAGAAVADGADGVVVVQGTDTIEETSYLLDLLWPHPHPVVVTGAMRNPTLAGADGPANLLAAVTVAANPRFRDQGVLVAFADQVHAARFVHKAHTTHVATFVSPNAGPLGLLVEGRAVPLACVRRASVHRPDRPLAARVPVAAVAMDDDPEHVVAVGAGADALVVAGLGAGHVPPALAEPLGELARRIPVVLASRTGSGPTLSATYGFAGSETDLLARGLVSSGFLDPYKARVLLRVALGCGYDAGGIRAAFAEHGGLG